MNRNPRLLNDSLFRVLAFVIAGLVTLFSAGPALAQPVPELIISHPPNQNGGFASDTLYVSNGQQRWQLCSDDVLLLQAAVISRITWWGFYNLDNPPSNETMRIRFYSARQSDGLPGDILSEQTVANPPRIPTGQIVFVGVLPREFRYETDLPTPFSMQAGLTYWLEIAQVGDVDTHFRWETSSVGNDTHAFVNYLVGDWRYSLNTTDLAFELWGVPEPASLILLLVGSPVLLGARRRR